MNKRILSQFAAAFLVVLLLISSASPAFAGDSVLIGVNARFLYEDARSMLAMINDFRTGSDAWYVDTDNRTRVSVRGLKKLEYDYSLEKTAMLRAMEIAVLYSHTRPDGSSWNTSYPFPVGRFYMGENVAYGYGSAFRVFQAFREDNLPYAWQGHRRNMLHREFTRVGFGAVKVGNMIYWAQEFASGKAGGSARKMSAKSVKASWKTLRQVGLNIQPIGEDLVILKGLSVSMPKAYLISDSGARNTLSGLSWKPAKTKIVKVKKSKLVGKQTGNTVLTAKVAGVTLRMNASVVSSVSPPVDQSQEIENYDTPLGLDLDFVHLEPEEACFQPAIEGEETGSPSADEEASPFGVTDEEESNLPFAGEEETSSPSADDAEGEP